MAFKRTFDINPTPGELAKVFAEWADVEQAEFLELVYREFGRWGGHKRDMQLLGIGDKLRTQWPNAAQMVRELAADTEADQSEGEER